MPAWLSRSRDWPALKKILKLTTGHLLKDNTPSQSLESILVEGYPELFSIVKNKFTLKANNNYANMIHALYGSAPSIISPSDLNKDLDPAKFNAEKLMALHRIDPKNFLWLILKSTIPIPNLPPDNKIATLLEIATAFKKNKFETSKPEARIIELANTAFTIAQAQKDPRLLEYCRNNFLHLINNKKVVKELQNKYPLPIAPASLIKPTVQQSEENTTRPTTPVSDTDENSSITAFSTSFSHNSPPITVTPQPSQDEIISAQHEEKKINTPTEGNGSITAKEELKQPDLSLQESVIHEQQINTEEKFRQEKAEERKQDIASEKTSIRENILILKDLIAQKQAMPPAKNNSVSIQELENTAGELEESISTFLSAGTLTKIMAIIDEEKDDNTDDDIDGSIIISIELLNDVLDAMEDTLPNDLEGLSELEEQLDELSYRISLTVVSLERFLEEQQLQIQAETEQEIALEKDNLRENIPILKNLIAQKTITALDKNNPTIYQKLTVIEALEESIDAFLNPDVLPNRHDRIHEERDDDDIISIELLDEILAAMEEPLPNDLQGIYELHEQLENLSLFTSRTITALEYFLEKKQLQTQSEIEKKITESTTTVLESDSEKKTIDAPIVFDRTNTDDSINHTSPTPSQATSENSGIATPIDINPVEDQKLSIQSNVVKTDTFEDKLKAAREKLKPSARSDKNDLANIQAQAQAQAHIKEQLEQAKNSSTETQIPISVEPFVQQTVVKETEGIGPKNDSIQSLSGIQQFEEEYIQNQVIQALDKSIQQVSGFIKNGREKKQDLELIKKAITACFAKGGDRSKVPDLLQDFANKANQYRYKQKDTHSFQAFKKAIKAINKDIDLNNTTSTPYSSSQPPSVTPPLKK